MYLAGFLSSEILQLAVFEQDERLIIYYDYYPLTKDFSIINTLESFLNDYQEYFRENIRPNHYYQIQHTVIAGDLIDETILTVFYREYIPFWLIYFFGWTINLQLSSLMRYAFYRIVDFSSLGLKLKLTRGDISEIMQKQNHSPDVYLLNDFECLAYSLLFFDKHGFNKSDFESINGEINDLLQDFTPEEKANISQEEQDNIKEEKNKITTKKYLWKTEKKSLVIGLDAGLGIAAVPYGVKRKGLPYIGTSAGGYSTFSPEWKDAIKLVQNIQDIQCNEYFLIYFLKSALESGSHSLIRYVFSKMGRLYFLSHRAMQVIYNYFLSNQDSLSHRGIQIIYNYFLYQRKSPPNYKFSNKDVVYAAFNDDNDSAFDTVRFVCEVLGELCGNMADIFNCNDSIFLWSDTLKDIQIDFLRNHFQNRFSARPKHGTKIGKIPVFLIMNDNFPLYGCAYYSECYVNNLNKKNS